MSFDDELVVSVCVCVCVCVSCSAVSDSLRPHGLQPARLLRPWDFPAKNIGVGCHFLFHVVREGQLDGAV